MNQKPKTSKRGGSVLVIGAVCGGMAVVIVLALIITGVIGGKKANRVSRGGTLTAGKDIANEDITEFYYTYASSTFPPDYQRYRFYTENVVYWFYHETREGEHFPLTEDDITVSGSAELSNEEWAAFLACVSGGTVKAREKNTGAGNDGPWLYLYWNGDQSVYQEFSFSTAEKRASFMQLCESLS